MGTTAELKQVSPYLLEKLTKHPDFAEVFLVAKYLPESLFWDEFTINLKNFDFSEWYKFYTNLATSTLERLKEEKPEELEKLQPDIPLILTEGKAAYLDLGKKWNQMHFLLTGYNHLLTPKFLVSKNRQDYLPAINAIKGGRSIKYYTGYEFVRYLRNDEVQEIARALSSFSHEHIRKRLKLRGLSEEKYHHLWYSTYNSLVKYYRDAASKGNAMFLYLT
jgi:hypothetical protein